MRLGEKIFDTLARALRFKHSGPHRELVPREWHGHAFEVIEHVPAHALDIEPELGVLEQIRLVVRVWRPSGVAREVKIVIAELPADAFGAEHFRLPIEA